MKKKKIRNEKISENNLEPNKDIFMPSAIINDMTTHTYKNRKCLNENFQNHDRKADAYDLRKYRRKNIKWMLLS